MTGAPTTAGLTVNVSALLSDPCALVAVNVMLLLAVAVGVPDNTPAELNDIPAGSVSGVTPQVIGAVPVAVNVVVGYTVLTVPATRNDGLVMVGASDRDQRRVTFTAPGMSYDWVIVRMSLFAPDQSSVSEPG